MTTRFVPLENRCFGRSESANKTSQAQTHRASNRSFQAEPNFPKAQDKYDYNPNITHKTKIGGFTQLRNWSTVEKGPEGSRKTITNRDYSTAQQSNRIRDITTNVPAQKESHRRASTEGNFSARVGRPDPKAQFEVALYRHKQFLAEQARYGQELQDQIVDKQKREHNEKVKDITSNNSTGLAVGEVNGGLDINGLAKNMRIRENKEAIRKSLDRSFTNTERSASAQSLRDFNSHHGYSSVNQSLIHNHQTMDASLIDEREEEEFEAVEKYSPEYHQRRISKERGDPPKKNSKDFSECNGNKVDSRYQLKKVHHQKLKQSLQNQLKKHEEYTTKLLQDQQKRRHDMGQALDIQVISNQFRRKGSEHREKMQEKAHEGFNTLNSQPSERAWETKNALLAEIEKKYKTKLDSKQNEKSSEPIKRLDRNGRYKRLIDDTVKRILSKKEVTPVQYNKEKTMPTEERQVL